MEAEMLPNYAKVLRIDCFIFGLFDRQIDNRADPLAGGYGSLFCYHANKELNFFNTFS